MVMPQAPAATSRIEASISRGLVEDLVLNGDRGEDADDVAVDAAGQKDQALLQCLDTHRIGEIRIWLVGSRDLEFDGVHEAEAADVHDVRNIGASAFEALLQTVAELVGAVAELLFFDDVEYGMGGSDGQRVAGIGAARPPGPGASISSARPVTADSGKPPARLFAIVVRSGTTS